MILDNIKMLAINTAAKVLVKTSVGQAVTKKAVEKFMVEHSIPGSVTTPTADDHKWVIELGSQEGEACIVVHASEDLLCSLCEAYTANKAGNFDKCDAIIEAISKRFLTR